MENDNQLEDRMLAACFLLSCRITITYLFSFSAGSKIPAEYIPQDLARGE